MKTIRKMNFRRAVVSWLLVCAMMVGLTPLMGGGVYAEMTSGNWGDLTWSFDEKTGTLTIEGEGEMKDLPGNVDAWKSLSSEIVNVNLSKGITSIGNYAFLNCINMTSVSIPDSVISIGSQAFSYCGSLKSVYISDSVVSIGSRVFYDCNSLTDITISNNLSSMGEYLFSGCSSLTGVRIPEGVKSIENGTFFNCNSLKNLIIADSVTSIGHNAFSNCNSLTSVVIPNNVRTIRDEAFSRCKSLVSVTIPKNVNNMDKDIFLGCENLKEINVETGNQKYKSGEGVLYDKSGSTLIQYPPAKEAEWFLIPDGVKTIQYHAFAYCNSLKKVNIPNSVDKITISQSTVLYTRR